VPLGDCQPENALRILTKLAAPMQH